MSEPTNKSFHITKAQMAIITQLRNGLIISLVPNYKELKLDILSIGSLTTITKQLLLALSRRKLIKQLSIHSQVELTPLGLRMANLGLKPENLGKSIFAKNPTQKDIKASLNVSRNGYEIQEDIKKRAKASYKRNINQSYQ